MKLWKRLAAGLLAGVMAVSAVPAGTSAETSGEEWTDEDTFNSILYMAWKNGGALFADHAEETHTFPIVDIDERKTVLGALTGNNSLLITADQLKSDEYNDKVCLSLNFSFENHQNLSNLSNGMGEVVFSSVDGSFTSTEYIYSTTVEDTSTERAVLNTFVVCKKEDLQSGIMIRLAEETETYYYDGINKLVRSGNPLYLRCVTVCNIYNYEKTATLEGISGDLDALGSITIPASMLADYPAGDEKRPGALLCFEYDVKSDVPQYGTAFIDYFVTGETIIYSGTTLLNTGSDNYGLMSLYDDRPKKNGLTINLHDDDHGVILKSVSVYLPIGVTYPAESGYQSVGESIAALGTGKTVVQKTSVKDGKYDARFVEKVNTSELSGKSKAVFSLSNGTKTSSVSTNKYYTSLTADGETISAENGTVFLAYTVKDIPEDVNVTVTGVTLE